ncbi:TPA: restriction endonuclease subunit S [Vibrio parahaemolyticus]|uniref:restriction endonuclease subunit S n=1 Tax=Vibrio parahaemolyticus TaxID=670 RepID=UPI00215D5660|nr:restriction endonuclease subunit S [Vibrio parahaemolyticus]MCS0049058.1 restriction endonuclease subunit S [Vibrio parahaemolyticus]MDF4597934.1 restriction endonuclease subunit S [Vibrio parahaemolyticus]MDF4729787.1 restriction endonuclease subunit S [Vibrio parahaemolyticus]HCH0249112.1 restriction endonuclease subunit S [Vibrio parahaemolyticus]HCH0301021.1 restriction endonuclease subunit S [Vibrio parahaemolyticus]
MNFDLVTYELGELGSLKNGANFNKNDAGDGCPVMSVKQLFRGRFVDTEGLGSIKLGTLKKLDDYLVKKNDLLFARSSLKAEGSGQVAIVNEYPQNCIFSGFTIRFRVFDESKVNPLYLYYLLRSPKYREIFVRITTGSVISNLTQATLSKIPVELPNKETQDYVANIFDELDRKRELGAATNQTLEQLAQAIFKSWFVDFDPVKAKMNGEQPEGMDAATASLFPEKLVESELGLIPEGWEVGTLDSHTSMIIDHRGKTPKKLGSDWVEEGYPAISAKNIKSKKIVRLDTIRFIDEATYKKWMKEPLIKGDIIMTSEAPMGELYFFDGSEDFCLSQRLYGLRANSDVCSPEFLFNWLQTTKAKADMEGRASGTTALGIKQAELRKVKILTPPLELLEKYSAVASNLVDMAAKNNAQNTVLEDLRDTLLPKLLSGEIELGETEEMAEVN